MNPSVVVHGQDKARAVASGVIGSAAFLRQQRIYVEHYRALVMLFALLLGFATIFLFVDDRCKQGIDAASRD